jgi:hypothetical protein
MNGMNRRWNNLWIGLIVGLALPLLVFLGFYLIMYARVPFSEYVCYTLKMRTLPKILSLCAIPNLGIFYILLNKEYWWATRGIIAAMFVYVLGIVAIKIFC